jgi:hypothetical protein
MVKQLQEFLGLLNIYRRIHPATAARILKVKPLAEFLKGGKSAAPTAVEWTPEFLLLSGALTNFLCKTAAIEKYLAFE